MPPMRGTQGKPRYWPDRGDSCIICDHFMGVCWRLGNRALQIQAGLPWRRKRRLRRERRCRKLPHADAIYNVSPQARIVSRLGRAPEVPRRPNLLCVVSGWNRPPPWCRIGAFRCRRRSSEAARHWYLRAAHQEKPGGNKSRRTACLTLPEHCDIPPPNVRVWRNW